ncbi:hypothetical protein BJ741DRAFT_588496 [Chytriomyces cf. hyalinus JEL632]|nr:hypothetical protein BJ741DRAFT_588496 [Chytriomyces cf. hyalinus JEL632]
MFSLLPHEIVAQIVRHLPIDDTCDLTGIGFLCRSLGRVLLCDAAFARTHVVWYKATASRKQRLITRPGSTWYKLHYYYKAALLVEWAADTPRLRVEESSTFCIWDERFCTQDVSMRIVCLIESRVEFYGASTSSSRFLCWAAEMGFECVVEWLSDTHGEQLEMSAYPLHIACLVNRSSVLRVLMGRRLIDRMNLMQRDCTLCLTNAADRGFTEIVRLLMEDDRFNPEVALQCAVVNDREEVARLVLADGRVDPGRLKCLEKAVEYGSINVLMALLADGRADPADSNNACLVGAIHKGHIRMIKAILKDGRVDATRALIQAVRKPRCSMQAVEVMLCHPSTDLIYGNYAVVWSSCYCGNLGIVRMILNSPKLGSHASAAKDAARKRLALLQVSEAMIRAI